MLAFLAAAKERAPIVDSTFYDAVIIGGGASAVTAAARLASRGKTVMLIERGPKLGLEGGACDDKAPLSLLPGAERIEKSYDLEGLFRALPSTDTIKVRLRARAENVTPGEHLVSVRYLYQGLPRLVRARYAVLSWPGEAEVSQPVPQPGRVFDVSSMPGRPVLKGHCVAGEILTRLGSTREDWPPCGQP